MRQILILIAIFTFGTGAVLGQSGDGHARRGAAFEQIDMDAGTVEACAALCDRDARCQAWSYARAGLMGPYPQCALLSAVTTPISQPGHTTGLSTRLSERISAAAERPLSESELIALRATYSPYPR